MHACTDIPVPPVFKPPRLSPIQGFIDYLKSCYRNSQFPTYFKQPSLRIKPKNFIHLNIVSNEDTLLKQGCQYTRL